MVICSKFTFGLCFHSPKEIQVNYFSWACVKTYLFILFVLARVSTVSFAKTSLSFSKSMWCSHSWFWGCKLLLAFTRQIIQMNFLFWLQKHPLGNAETSCNFSGESQESASPVTAVTSQLYQPSPSLLGAECSFAALAFTHRWIWCALAQWGQEVPFHGSDKAWAPLQMSREVLGMGPSLKFIVQLVFPHWSVLAQKLRLWWWDDS